MSDLKREFDGMSDRELREVCGILMPIISKRFNKAKQGKRFKKGVLLSTPEPKCCGITFCTAADYRKSPPVCFTCGKPLPAQLCP